MKTEQEIKDKIENLKKDEKKFIDFLRDVYGDKNCKQKIDLHLWRINREIDILKWVINQELPF